MKSSQRKIVVLMSLVGLLTLTSALLLALEPPPLTADRYNTLAAAEPNDTLGDVFKTTVAAEPGRWKYIYIHHSATPSGSAVTLAQPGATLGDHFVIGNGNGCQDGEIQVSPLWDRQLAPLPPAGVEHIEPDCISICMIGDYDKATPTPTQVRRLSQLVSTIQAQLRIPADHVYLLNQPGNAAGIGRFFPSTAFREQILP